MTFLIQPHMCTVTICETSLTLKTDGTETMVYVYALGKQSILNTANALATLTRAQTQTTHHHTFVFLFRTWTWIKTFTFSWYKAHKQKKE